MGTRHSLTVVIPAFNVEDWIGRTLQSVVDQEVQPTEVIIVDDGSEDGTAQVAKTFLPEVHVVHQKRRGVAAARNTGASLAQSDLILFLDADDVLLEGAIAHALSAWEASAPRAGVCIPNHVWGRGDHLFSAWPEDQTVRLLQRDDVPSILRRNWLFANGFVRRDVWLRSPFDPSIRGGEDLDFYVRLLLSGVSIAVLGRPGVRMSLKRQGSATARTHFMRAERRRLFKKLAREPDLEFRERAIVTRQRLRSTVGQLIASREQLGADLSPKTILQVLVDERGGAGQHIALLERSLAEEFAFSTVRISPGRPGVAWARLARQIQEALRRTQSGVVHAHGVRAAAVVAFSRPRRLRVRSVVTVHGLHSVRRSQGVVRAAAIVFNRWVLSHFDVVVALSETDRQTILDLKLASSGSTRLVEPGIPSVHAGPPRDSGSLPLEDKLSVVWMARFVPQKDPLTFVRAASHLDESVRWLMVGDGPMLDEARMLASAFSLSVEFLGWSEDTDGVLAQSTIFVSTSLWEGLPIALLEAATRCVPIIATEVSGNRDLADKGIPILLVPARDPSRLATAISSLLRDEQRREAMAKEGSAVVRREFSVDRWRRDMKVIYNSLFQ